jgi:hypothetical protein
VAAQSRQIGSAEQACGQREAREEQVLRRHAEGAKPAHRLTARSAVTDAAPGGHRAGPDPVDVRVGHDAGDSVQTRTVRQDRRRVEGREERLAFRAQPVDEGAPEPLRGEAIDGAHEEGRRGRIALRIKLRDSREPAQEPSDWAADHGVARRPRQPFVDAPGVLPENLLPLAGQRPSIEPLHLGTECAGEGVGGAQVTETHVHRDDHREGHGDSLHEISVARLLDRMRTARRHDAFSRAEGELARILFEFGAIAAGGGERMLGPGIGALQTARDRLKGALVG